VIPEQPECAKTTGSGDTESNGEGFTGRMGSFPSGNACVSTQARPAQVSRRRRGIAETANTGDAVFRLPEQMLQLF